MHIPGSGKNLRTARATPAPALSISASTSTPRANAAFSVSRICAELRIGEFISAAFIVATDEHRLTHFQFGASVFSVDLLCAAAVFLGAALFRLGLRTLLRFFAAGTFGARTLLAAVLGARKVRVADFGQIKVGLQRNSAGRGIAIAGGRIRDERAFSDPARDLVSELLAIRIVQGIARFRGVSEETALHEDGRNSGVPQHVITAAAHTTIRGRRTPGDVVMNGRCERQAVAVIEVGLNAICAPASGRVEMNADEDGVRI